tara:strand:- start:375 stop:569 length:195 start_codon:yes stop_codon:yes gene_type:complete
LARWYKIEQPTIPPPITTTWADVFNYPIPEANQVLERWSTLANIMSDQSCSIVSVTMTVNLGIL